MDRFTVEIVSNGVLASLFALALIVCSRFSVLKQRPALRHSLWILVLAKLITPSVIRVPVTPVQTSLASVGEIVEEHDAGMPLDAQQRLISASHSPPHSTPVAKSVVANRGREGANPPLTSMVRFLTFTCLTISLLGTICLVVMAILRGRRIGRLLRHADAGPEWLQNESARLARGFGLSHSPRILLVDATVTPLLWVSLRGALVVFPKGLLLQLSEKDVSAVIAHELAHCARRDHWVNFFAFGVSALCWWHPAAWYARHQVRESQEECCDSLVLAQGSTGARAYAEMLFTVLEFQSNEGAKAPIVLPSVGTVSSLRRRLEMLRETNVRPQISLRAKLFVISIAALLPCMPVASEKARALQPESGSTSGAATETERTSVDVTDTTASDTTEDTNAAAENGDTAQPKYNDVPMSVPPSTDVRLRGAMTADGTRYVSASWNACGKQIEARGQLVAVRGQSSVSFRAKKEGGLGFRTGNTNATIPHEVLLKVPVEQSLVVSRHDAREGLVGKLLFGNLLVFFDHLSLWQDAKHIEIRVYEDSFLLQTGDSEVQVSSEQFTLDLDTLRVRFENQLQL